MGADFSRDRFNSLRDYAGVQLKQGGVLLDADANELTGILDRRLRALASDVLGRARVSSTTPDAFKIAVVGSTLQIGRGRLYADGLLAENHGAASSDPAKREFDDLLAEPRFADPIAYAAQPYLPDPPKLPAGGRHLVYLDVWNRDVTHLEQPDLVEIAVGVETSSRLQTVWQVRVLGEDAGAGTTCATPDGEVPGWSTLIAASTGVLSTGTFEVAPINDPCELPPTGGYRGLENQLYRVEIHDAGQPGAGATFKFSRENASVGSAVESVISATELQLATLGRDDVLRFNTNDWVEITDDIRELSQAPGEMRRITVNDATQRVQFSPALPAEMLPPSFPDSVFPRTRHLRVRRWAQKGRVFRTDTGGTPVEVQNLDSAGSPGVIAVPASTTTLLLEHGITVTFDSTGSKGFRPRDYWVFAARTADASVEILDRAPPRGIHHHYVRLGIWDVATGAVTDCRPQWPPQADAGHDCSCTACVTAESHATGQFTIQDAVNQVQQAGGTVCLGPGQYALAEPVRVINCRALSIRGQGMATVVVGAGGVFALRDGVALVIENLAILSLGKQAAVTVSSVLGLSLRRLTIGVITADQRGAAIALQGVVVGASICENAIFAKFGIMANDPNAAAIGDEPPPDHLLAAALAIEDNVLWCQRQAVALNGAVLHHMRTRITGNEIAECRDVGVSALGLCVPGASITISRNSFNVAGSGIRCGLDGLWIEGNKLTSTATREVARENKTVAIALVTGLDKDGSDQCQVLANQIEGFGLAGILIGTPVRDLIVKLNIIQNCGNGIFSTEDANASAVSIENNHLRNIETSEGDTGTVTGIGVTRAQTATIAGNTVRAVGVQAVRSQLRAGILTFGARQARVTNNEVTEVAPPGDFVGLAAGIMLRAPHVGFDVTNNQVQRDAAASDQRSNGTWFALLAADIDADNPMSRAGGLVALRLDERRALVLGGGRPYVSIHPGAAAARPEPARGSVLGNVLNARGLAPAVEVQAGGECLFNNNRVEARLNEKVAVSLMTDAAIVNANRVRGGEVSIEVNAKSPAVLGNITTGVIRVPGGLLQSPWKELNLQA